MPNKDVAVGAVGVVQPGMSSSTILAGSVVAGSPISRKPTYLVVLDVIPGGTKKTEKKFIATEKPDLLDGFIQVKGIFTDSSEDEISKNFTDILTNSSKELFIEVMLPWHRICSIRNLVFRAK